VIIYHETLHLGYENMFKIIIDKLFYEKYIMNESA